MGLKWQVGILPNPPFSTEYAVSTNKPSPLSAITITTPKNPFVSVSWSGYLIGFLCQQKFSF